MDPIIPFVSRWTRFRNFVFFPSSRRFRALGSRRSFLPVRFPWRLRTPYHVILHGLHRSKPRRIKATSSVPIDIHGPPSLLQSAERLKALGYLDRTALYETTPSYTHAEIWAPQEYVFHPGSPPTGRRDQELKLPLRGLLGQEAAARIRGYKINLRVIREGNPDVKPLGERKKRTFFHSFLRMP